MLGQVRHRKEPNVVIEKCQRLDGILQQLIKVYLKEHIKKEEEEEVKMKYFTWTAALYLYIIFMCNEPK